MPVSDPPKSFSVKLKNWLQRQPRPLQRAFFLFSGAGARQGYLAAVDQGLISLANFIATVILARQVSPTELGVYGVGFTTLRLVRAVQEGLTIQPMNTFGPTMDEPAFKRYATATSVIQIGLALVTAAAVALTGWWVTKTGNDVAGPALFSLWSAFLWWQLQEYLRRMMYTRGDVADAVANTALANGVRLLVMLWWSRQGTLTGTGGLTAIGLGSLAALLPAIWQTRAYWGREITDLAGTWKRNWNFGRYMLGASLSTWVSVEFYPILTAGLISFAAAGAYRAIQNLVQPVQLLLRAMDTFLTPRAAKTYHQQGFTSLEKLLHKTYKIFAGPILGLLGLAVVFRVPLLTWLYGDTYLPYANGVILMAIFYGLWFAYWPLQTVMKAMHASRPIFIANLAAIVVMFSAGIWLIHQWGVYGTMAGQALNALVVAAIHLLAWRSLRRGALSLQPSLTPFPEDPDID